MNETEDDQQFEQLKAWLSKRSEDRKVINKIDDEFLRADRRSKRILLALLVISLAGILCALSTCVHAAGTVTDSKYVLLQRSGVTLTPNPASITECLARMAEMIDAELKSRTTGYVTYKCLDVSQRYVKFAKATNRAPTISGTPASTATVGQVYSFTPTASDPDGDKLTFVVDNRPPWATFDTATGALSGTPKAEHVGVRSELRIRVQDGRGGEAVLAFGKLTTALAPTPAASSVTLSWLPSTQNTDGSALTDLAGYRIVYGTSASALTQMIDVPANVSTYVVDQLTPATWYFAVKAYNAAGKESVNSNIASKTAP